MFTKALICLAAVASGVLAGKEDKKALAEMFFLEHADVPHVERAAQDVAKYQELGRLFLLEGACPDCIMKIESEEDLVAYINASASSEQLGAMTQVCGMAESAAKYVVA